MPECPMCHAALDPSAVLCVACGYHLQKQTFLATQIDRKPATPAEVPSASHDPNPYAAPAPIHDSPTQRVPTPEFDLTERGAKRAKAIVSDADNIRLVVLLSFCCQPIWVLMLPWYGYRLYSWYELNDTFAELRYPNSFAPHWLLAIKFQSAKVKLFVGVVVGAIYWAIGSVVIIVRLLW